MVKIVGSGGKQPPTSAANAAAPAAEVSQPQPTTPKNPVDSTSAAPPLSEQGKAKLKGSRNLSRRLPVMDLKSRLNQDLSKAPGKSADARGVQYTASAQTHQEMQKISEEGNQELKNLYAKYPNFSPDSGKRMVVDPDDKEKIARYENLMNALKDPVKANAIAQGIETNRSDPLYTHMGPTKFTSYLHQSNTNLASSGASSHGMTDIERVAVYGYTTGDYKAINGAMRSNNGQPPDAGMAAYAKHTTNGMKKLPDYQPPPGQEAKLYRAIFSEPSPNWGASTFVKGNTYSDHGFASTATALGGTGSWNLSIEGTKNAKDVGPYSAWPGEKEVLTLPGTKYTVSDVQGSKVTLIPQ